MATKKKESNDILLAMLQNRIGESKSCMVMVTANLLTVTPLKSIQKHGTQVLEVAGENLLNAYDSALVFYHKNKIDKELFNEMNAQPLRQISSQTPFKEMVEKNNYPAIREWLKQNKADK